MIKLINKKMLSIYDKYTFNICIIYIKFVYLTIHDTIKKIKIYSLYNSSFDNNV